MFEKPKHAAAATDVGEFFTDLDGGQLDTMLSVALSTTAAAVIDNSKKGKVTIELEFEQIKQTHQVVVNHKLTFKAPSRLGNKSETVIGASVLHVGKNGRLSLAQQRLMDSEQQPLPNT